MLDILHGTPFWVYVIYLWLCYYGVKACFGGQENLRSLLILPLVLVIWSFFSLNYPVLSATYWLGGLVLGGGLASAVFSGKDARLGADGKSLVLPGSVKILLISQLLFAVKFYLGYQAAVHPELTITTPMLTLAGSASGFAVGLFCGRAVRLYRRLLALQDHTPVQTPPPAA